MQPVRPADKATMAIAQNSVFIVILLMRSIVDERCDGEGLESQRCVSANYSGDWRPWGSRGCSAGSAMSGEGEAALDMSRDRELKIESHYELNGDAVSS
ncbi:hypothetical protein PUN4_760050 [Paraburkholderia unamae]|nr:hypothetical protein PUN4_760050 [Paraburkholderia unamae]